MRPLISVHCLAVTCRAVRAIALQLMYTAFLFPRSVLCCLFTPFYTPLCSLLLLFTGTLTLCNAKPPLPTLPFLPPVFLSLAGTGKTLLARAVAHHTDCTFIRVSGSELVQKYIGEGSRMVRELFIMAR